MKKTTSAELKHHRARCFGRGKKRLRKAGPCPSSCKKHCRRFSFDDTKSPRVIGLRKDRPYTQVPNNLFGKWPLLQAPGLTARFVYLHLLSRTMPTSRMVSASAREMADDMGITYRAFCEHIRTLRKHGLVDVVPMRALHPYGDSNRMAFVMLDLPDALIEIRRSYAAIEIDVGDDDDDRDDGKADQRRR